VIGPSGDPVNRKQRMGIWALGSGLHSGARTAAGRKLTAESRAPASYFIRSADGPIIRSSNDPITRFCYLQLMPVKTIQLGQVWRNDENGSNYLVTKVYNEVFTQYAILRQADANAANSDTIRVKVQKGSDGSNLPGYTYTQEAQDF